MTEFLFMFNLHSTSRNFKEYINIVHVIAKHQQENYEKEHTTTIVFTNRGFYYLFNKCRLKTEKKYVQNSFIKECYWHVKMGLTSKLNRSILAAVTSEPLSRPFLIKNNAKINVEKNWKVSLPREPEPYTCIRVL